MSEQETEHVNTPAFRFQIAARIILGLGLATMFSSCVKTAEEADVNITDCYRMDTSCSAEEQWNLDRLGIGSLMAAFGLAFYRREEDVLAEAQVVKERPAPSAPSQDG